MVFQKSSLRVCIFQTTYHHSTRRYARSCEKTCRETDVEHVYTHCCNEGDLCNNKTKVGISCHECNQCSYPIKVNQTRIIDNCLTCQEKIIYATGLFYRQCNVLCQPLVFENKGVIACCKTDLCNDGISLQNGSVVSSRTATPIEDGSSNDKKTIFSTQKPGSNSGSDSMVNYSLKQLSGYLFLFHRNLWIISLLLRQNYVLVNFCL
jgi:hypothetical protein